MKRFLIFLILAFGLAGTLRAQQLVNGARGFPQPNDGATGTTINTLAIINTSGNAITATVSNTSVPTYVVTGGAGTTGNAVLGTIGVAPCIMDSTIASAAGNFYVIASVTNAGDCHAQSAAPSSGIWIVGYLHDSSTSSGVTALVDLNGFINSTGIHSWTILPYNAAAGVNLAASTNYIYAISGPANGKTCASATGTSTNLYAPMPVPLTGTVTGMFVNTYVGGTLSSAQNVTFKLCYNGAATALTTTQSWASASPAVASDTAHTAAVTAGGLMAIEVDTPAWSTNPTTVYFDVTLKMLGTN